MECSALLHRLHSDGAGTALDAIADHSCDLRGVRTNRRRAIALEFRWISINQSLRVGRKVLRRGGSMSHSPLASAIVLRIGPVALTETVITTWLLIAVLAIVCRLVTRRMSVVPGDLQAVIETLVGAIEEQIRGIVNRDPAEFLPLLGTLFIFLVVANLAAVLPGVHAPTASIETPAALAAIIFFSVHVFGLRLQGVAGYLKGYLKPNPLLLPLNVLSEFTRSFSLMMRLFGNIMSDELVIAIVVALAGLLVPIPFMAFEILVGLVQAYIFSVLAAVYIGGAVGSIEK
jgi:F-type H+-transporting ATPase subunit a